MDANTLTVGGEGLQIFRSIISLIFVLGLMGGVWYWLKRKGGVLPGAANRRMRVIERLPIDSRRSILLVQIDGEEMVVGVGSDSVTPIRVQKMEKTDEK